MANVDINVGGTSYNVDINGIEDMSPADQQAAVRTVTAHIGSGQGSPAAPQAAPDGPPAPGDTSFLSAAKQGFHNTGTGLAATADLAAGGPSMVGNAIRAVTPNTPANYQEPDLAGTLRAGSLPSLHQLGQSLIEGAPDLAATLGAGAVAGPAGMAGYTAARGLGQNVQAAQQANGDASPTLGDYARGAAGTAVDVGANLVGLKGAGGIVANAARDAASQTVGNAVKQGVMTAGTNQGLTIDPDEAAAVGLQAGVTRAAGGVVHAAADPAQAGFNAVKGAVQNTSDAIMASRMDQPASVADAASIARARSMYQDAMLASSNTNGNTTPTVVMNNVKSNLVNGILTPLKGFKANGDITPDEFATARLVVDQAQRHNNTVTDPDLDAAFDNLQLPSDTIDALKAGVRDLNTASTQSFLKNQTGPGQMIGNAIGQVAGVGGALATGNLPAAALAAIGHNKTGALGGMIGSKVDNLIGTATPTLLLRARLADKMLSANGAQQGPDTMAGLQQAQQLAAGGRRQSLWPIHAAAGFSIACGSGRPSAGSRSGAARQRPQGPPQAPLAPSPGPTPTAAPQAPHSLACARSCASPGSRPPRLLRRRPRSLPDGCATLPTGAPLRPTKCTPRSTPRRPMAILRPEQAAALKAHPGGADAATLAAPCSPISGPGRLGSPASLLPAFRQATAGRSMIQQKYAAATSQYAQHASDKLGLAGGDPALQAAILNIRDTPGAGKKQALAGAYLASVANDPPKLALAQALLSGPPPRQ